jgi:crotonobetainyl-CoA:carnitine CoA-transferase CaiB-like acyl-CoA transferase
VGALDGIKVIDLSRVLAGPFCGQLLADNGAEVIKIEAPGGDLNRAFPHVLGPGESTNFNSVNRGKRDLTLNLKSPEARDILYKLVAKADVLIQSFLPPTAADLGVDYEAMRKLNPNLIYATVSGYGQKGELRNKAGYDMMVAAYGGLMSLTGEPDRPPVKMGVPAVDIATGLICYGGITTALLARANGAGGQRVDASLLETAVTLLSFHATTFLATGNVSQREGSGYTSIAPYAPYKCADGEILLGAPSQAGWLKLVAALGKPQLGTDPRFTDNAARCAHIDELRAEIEGALASAGKKEWLAKLEAAGLPCAPINTVDQVMTDPQVIANDMVVTSKRPDGTELKLSGLPFKLSGTPGKPGVAPPKPGEHNEEILGQWLGLGEADVAALAAKGAI